MHHGGKAAHSQRVHPLQGTERVYKDLPSISSMSSLPYTHLTSVSLSLSYCLRGSKIQQKALPELGALWPPVVRCSRDNGAIQLKALRPIVVNQARGTIRLMEDLRVHDRDVKQIREMPGYGVTNVSSKILKSIRYFTGSQ